MRAPDAPKPTTVTICAKCSDLCYTEVKAADGFVIAEHDGYVPEFMPGDHYGDYVMLDIDIATGRILNWKPGDSIQKFIDENPKSDI